MNPNAAPWWYDAGCTLNSTLYACIASAAATRVGDLMWNLIIVSGVISALFRCTRLLSTCNASFGMWCNSTCSAMWVMDLILAALVLQKTVLQHVEGAKVTAALMLLSWTLYIVNDNVSACIAHMVAHSLGSLYLLIYVMKRLGLRQF